MPQVPVDESKFAELRIEGLTMRGEKKLSVGDLRCRPPKFYREELFTRTLPQFRLQTVIDAAHGEDIVMLWAHVTGRGMYSHFAILTSNSPNSISDPSYFFILNRA